MTFGEFKVALRNFEDTDRSRTDHNDESVVMKVANMKHLLVLLVDNIAINLTVVVKKPKISCGAVFVKHLHTQTKLVGEN